MRTVIKDKELGNVEIITQQYESGLYVAIYNNKELVTQFGSKLKERTYHINIRVKAIKEGDSIIEGNVIDNYKGNYPINIFENEKSKETSKEAIKDKG